MILNIYYLISIFTLIAFVLCIIDVLQSLKIYINDKPELKQKIKESKEFKSNKFKIFLQVIFICFCPILHLFSFWIFVFSTKDFEKEVRDAVLDKIKVIERSI